MINFTAYNPVRLHFGKGVVKELGSAAAELGKKALLVYGGGSVKRNGSYDDTVAQLNAAGIEVIEYGGIKPNPLASDVDEAAALGRKNKVEFIVAVGGGSAIDSAKVLSACIAENVSAWQIMSRKVDPSSALPLISVLTLAATGTEMNAAAVLQNPETRQKIGLRHPVFYPRHSYLDPGYTLSVPANYTSFGIVDLVAHALEAWFGEGSAPMSDRFVAAIIKEAMEIGPKLMGDLSNYEYRERIMWAATCALNDVTVHGRRSGDWGVHGMGHVLSFLYDTAHGATLSIVYPAWLRRLAEKQPARIVELGKALFDVDTASAAIEELEGFFTSISSPIRASEAGIAEDRKGEIL